MAANSVHVGCSGWNYDHWRNGVFYPPRCPPGRWLAFYAERFDSVEVNATFYRLPGLTAVERWAAETPDNFVFSVKVSRYVTHVKRLADAGAHLALLLARLAPLIDSGKLGPLLWQLPPTFRRDDSRLAAALSEFPPELRHAMEFRHRSWFADVPLSLLRHHGVALVLADRRGTEPPGLVADVGFTYVRFHEGSRGRRGNYSNAELEEWGKVIGGLATRGDVYAYFNNDWEGFAPRNALELRRLVRW
jgi:uncharacterized protein YecE (DUF72 family)